MTTVRCPRCGFDQPEGVECARCGIVIARFRDQSATARPWTRHLSAGVRQTPEASVSRRSWIVVFLIVVALALAVATLWRRSSFTEHAPEAPVASDASPPPAAVMSPSPVTPSLMVLSAVADDSTPTPEKPAACPFLVMSAPPLPSKPPFPGYWFEGASEFDRAKRIHERSGTPLFVYFFTDWCPFCRELERNLLYSVDIERYLRDTAIRARVNPEASDEDQRLAARWGVVKFPTLLLFLPGANPRRLPTRDVEGTESRLKTKDAFKEQITKRIKRLVRQRLQEAYARRLEGDPSAAIDILDSLTSLRPEEPEIYLQRAAAHATRGDRERAFEDLRRVYELASDEIRTFQQADAMLASEIRWSEIAACWSAFIEHHPDNPRAYLERGGALFRKGDREGSRRDAEAACRLGEPQACDLVARLTR